MKPESGDDTARDSPMCNRTSEVRAYARPGMTIRSMPEMPDAGEHHGDAVIVGGLDDFIVAHRTAGLDHRGGAGFDRDQKSIGERKERVRGHHRTPGHRSGNLQFISGVLGLAPAHARLLTPALRP